MKFAMAQKYSCNTIQLSLFCMQFHFEIIFEGVQETRQRGSGATRKGDEMLKFSWQEEGKKEQETEGNGKEWKGLKLGKERNGKKRKGKGE